MASIDPALVDNQWIFPERRRRSRKSFVFMTADTEQKDIEYQRAFQKAIGD